MNKALLASFVAAAFVSVSPFASAQSVDSAEPTIVAQAQTADEALVLAQAQQGSRDQARAARPGADRQHLRSATERVEARIAYARTALKITDSQQPQWENLANVMRKHARDRDQRMQAFHAKWEAARAQGQRPDGATQRPERPNFSAIERLERTQQRMNERSARLNEVLGAAKPLYAAFSPEQKQIADAMLARQGHGGHGRHGGHRHEQHRGMHRGA